VTYFTNLGDPAELVHLDIIWSIVLASEVKEVYEPAIKLLVHSHLAFQEARGVSEEQRVAYLSAFLARCFDLVGANANPSTLVVHRVTHILKEVIYQSEVNGTVGVRPHRSILKGELLDHILIKYMAPRNVWGEEKVERAIVVKLYTSCTVWEFKSEIARLVGLAPKYLEFEFPGKKVLEEKQHGDDM